MAQLLHLQQPRQVQILLADIDRGGYDIGVGTLDDHLRFPQCGHDLLGGKDFLPAFLPHQVLEVADHGQGKIAHDEVALDVLVIPDEHRPGLEVGLQHPEAFLYLPLAPVDRHHLLGAQVQAVRDHRIVAVVAGGLGDPGLVYGVRGKMFLPSR